MPTATAGTPVPFEWERTIACEPGASEVIPESELRYLVQRLTFWRGWVNEFSDAPQVPEEIGLAVIAQESRGHPGARGCAGEVGLFQIVPSDPSKDDLSPGCPKQTLPDFPENPSRSQASNSMFNVKWGMGHLRDMAWYAEAIGNGYSYDKTQPAYDDFLANAEFSRLGWWYESRRGSWAIAMYQCGQLGFWMGDCGKYGGSVYADEILNCWVPWIQANVIDAAEEG